jgi:hypothetical protein
MHGMLQINKVDRPWDSVDRKLVRGHFAEDDAMGMIGIQKGEQREMRPSG